MPRFVATLRIERIYSLWPAPRVIDGDVPETPPFAPFPTDWIVETSPVAADDDGRPRIGMTATRTVAVLARNEKDAEAKALECAASWRDDVPDQRVAGTWISHDAGQPRILSMRREAAFPRHRRSFEVDLDALVAPDVGPHLLTTDRMFETFRWMVATSRNYEQPAPYAPITVHGLLKGDSGRWDERIGLVTSREDLHRRLQAGILGKRHAIYEQWRSEHGIVRGATLLIEREHHGPSMKDMSSVHGGQSVEASLWTAMRDLPGHLMARSPNSCHARATMIHAFGVAVSPEGFAFRIRYGMDDESPDGRHSSWSHDVALTRGDEPFYDTAERAMALVHEIVPTYRADRRRLAS